MTGRSAISHQPSIRLERVGYSPGGGALKQDTSFAKRLVPKEFQCGLGHLRPGHAVLLVKMFGNISALTKFIPDAQGGHRMWQASTR